MQAIETNPFPCFIPPGTKKLIIGSFPCFNGRDYGDWFYSGSGKSHFWQLLSDSLLMPAGNREEKERLCVAHGIALSDIAYRIVRKQNNCSDSNLQIIEFNSKALQQCLDAEPATILFTGMFVRRHFYRLFPDCTLPSVVLVSPSPAANMHIGGLEEYKKMKSQGLISTPYEYRLVKYRELLIG